MTAFRTTIFLLVALILLAPASFGQEEKEEWKDLSGTGFDRWQVPTDEGATWKAEEGTIRIENRDGPPESNLIGRDDVTDFDLRLELHIEEGYVSLRKWRSFTLHLAGDTIPQNRWFEVELSVRGKEAHLYLDGSEVELSNTSLFKRGTNRIWLMGQRGAVASFRGIRLRHAEADDPNPFTREEEAPAPPDLSEARSLFSGASLLGWDRHGDWTAADGSIVGQRETPQHPSILYTGRPDWTDGVLGFEYQGIGEGETLVVFLNLDTEAWEATQITLGNDGIEEDAWVPVTLEFRGDEVVLWITGERYNFPRATQTGKIGFALEPGTELRLRNIRIALDR